MRGGTSAHGAMLAFAQEAADQAAVNALNILSEWVREKGHPALADDMLATFGAPSEGDPDQTEIPFAEPDAPAMESAPEAEPQPGHQAILITGED